MVQLLHVDEQKQGSCPHKLHRPPIAHSQVFSACLTLPPVSRLTSSESSCAGSC